MSDKGCKGIADGPKSALLGDTTANAATRTVNDPAGGLRIEKDQRPIRPFLRNALLQPVNSSSLAIGLGGVWEASSIVHMVGSERVSLESRPAWSPTITGGGPKTVGLQDQTLEQSHHSNRA